MVESGPRIFHLPADPFPFREPPTQGTGCSAGLLRMKILLPWLACLTLLITPARSQTTYQRYDCLTRGVEYHIAKSQIESNRKMIRMLENEKRKHSVLNPQGSVTRSRIQGVIGAKQEENFRLSQKAFLLMDANQVQDPARNNAALQQLRPKPAPAR